MCKEVEREVCGTCHFWSANEGDNRGMCHVLPPTVVDDQHKHKLVAVSPYTGKDRAACSLWQLGSGER